MRAATFDACLFGSGRICELASAAPNYDHQGDRVHKTKILPASSHVWACMTAAGIGAATNTGPSLVPAHKHRVRALTSAANYYFRFGHYKLRKFREEGKPKGCERRQAQPEDNYGQW